MLLQRTNLFSISIVTVFWISESGRIDCLSAALRWFVANYASVEVSDALISCYLQKELEALRRHRCHAERLLSLRHRSFVTQPLLYSIAYIRDSRQ